MGVREAMNEIPRATGIAAGLIAIVAIAAAVYSMVGRERPGVGAATKAFFTDDDGKTYFSDDVLKISGFDRNGRPAYRAYVFTAGGAPFVGYLERFTPEAQASLATLRKAATKGPPDSKLQRVVTDGTEIKRPGEAKWVKRTGPDAVALISTIKASDGASDLEPVLP